MDGETISEGLDIIKQDEADCCVPKPCLSDEDEDALVENDCENVENESEPTNEPLYNSMFMDHSDDVVVKQELEQLESDSMSDDTDDQSKLSRRDYSCFHNAELNVECDEMEGDGDLCLSDSHQKTGRFQWPYMYEPRKPWQKVRIFRGDTKAIPPKKWRRKLWTFEEERALIEFVSYNRDLQANPDAMWPAMSVDCEGDYWGKAAAFIKEKASTPYLRIAGALRSHLMKIRNQDESFDAAEEAYGITIDYIMGTVPEESAGMAGGKGDKSHGHVAASTAGNTKLHIFPKGSNEAKEYSAANCLAVSKHARKRVHTGTITFKCDDCDKAFSFLGDYVLTEMHQEASSKSHIPRSGSGTSPSSAVNRPDNGTSLPLLSATTKPGSGTSLISATNIPDSGTSLISAITKPGNSTSLSSATTKSGNGTSLSSATTKPGNGTSLSSATNRPGSGTSLSYTTTKPSCGTSLGIEHKHGCIEHRQIHAQCSHCDRSHASMPKPPDPGPKPPDPGPKEKFECRECKKMFIEKRFYDEHKKIHDLEANLKVTGTNEKVFKCEKCDYYAASFATMRNHHYKLHIGKERTPVICEQCGKAVANMESLRTHQLCVHTDLRQHQCTVCGKAFKLSRHLKNHMTIHSEERPYKCDLCGLAFKRNDRMKRHRKNICQPKQSAGEDVTEGKFVCVTCGKRFLQEKTLEKHKRVHLRENPGVHLGPVTSP